jgi:hypothetical protein
MVVVVDPTRQRVVMNGRKLAMRKDMSVSALIARIREQELLGRFETIFVWCNQGKVVLAANCTVGEAAARHTVGDAPLELTWTKENTFG